MPGVETSVEAAATLAGLVRVLPAETWQALAGAMHDPAVIPFPPAFQVKHVQAAAPAPERFVPAEVWYLGDYAEGLMPFAGIEWVRMMTWCLVPNERFRKYSRWRDEGPYCRRSCEVELHALLCLLHIQAVADDGGCLVARGFVAKPPPLGAAQPP